MEWTGAERRSSGAERLKVGKPVSIFAGDKQSIVRARTVDLSTGGMRLDVDGGLGVGEKILFRIDLGEGFDPAVQGGEVVWSAPEHGTGVRFTAPEAEYRPPEPEPEPPAPPEAGDPVRLHIDRMDHHLKVEFVEADERALLVRTELPFLELGRSVRACYGEPGGSETTIEGVLARVMLEDGDRGGVPGIRLEIRTGEEDDEDPPAEACVEPAADEWEEEEATERDAVPPPEPEDALEARAEEPEDEDTDAMSDAFHSLTAGSVEDCSTEEPAIEPQYVIVLRAVSAFLLVAGRRAGDQAAKWAGEAWSRLVPWLRRTAPRLLARARTASSLATSLAARLAALARRGSPPAAPRKMRRQKRRTTQVSMAQKAGRAISSKARSRVLAAILAAAAILGFGTGIWGLVSLIASGEEDAAGGGGSQPANAEVSRGSFDMWGNSALPAGNVVEAPTAEIEMAEAPEPLASAVEAAPAMTAGQEPAADPAPPPAIDVPMPEEASGQGFYLGVSGEVTGYDFYPLKSPPGLVVDVKGALPLQEGSQPINRPGIKKVKAVARESGARFIIYFEGDEVPGFQVLPAGSTLEVRLDT